MIHAKVYWNSSVGQNACRVSCRQVPNTVSRRQPEPLHFSELTDPALETPTTLCQGKLCPQILAAAAIGSSPEVFIFGLGADQTMHYLPDRRQSRLVRKLVVPGCH